ncbi:hypothetical protein BpHYR1_010592, partial [Brachionus plicatilis]
IAFKASYKPTLYFVLSLLHYYFILNLTRLEKDSPVSEIRKILKNSLETIFSKHHCKKNWSIASLFYLVKYDKIFSKAPRHFLSKISSNKTVHFVFLLVSKEIKAKLNSTLGDLWFLKINISTAFENTISMNYLSKQNNIKSKCSSYFSTIHLHAILMFVGWAVLINISNILSKYLKSRKYTNVFSNCILMMGILFVTGGIIFGFWSSHGLPHLAHLIIGLAAYLLILVQPVIELIDCESKLRLSPFSSSSSKVRSSLSVSLMLILFSINLNNSVCLSKVF